MTESTCDLITHKDNIFLLLRADGERLFYPPNYKIDPTLSINPNYRGCNCDYKVENNFLKITQVYLNLDEEEENLLNSDRGLKLFGKVPSRYIEKDCDGKEHISWDFKCGDLDELIDFTGGILIGSKDINPYFTTRGYPEPYTFKNIYELVFDSGQIIEEIDYSKKMSDFRNMLRNKELEWETSEQHRDAKEWLRKCFSWNYEL